MAQLASKDVSGFLRSPRLQHSIYLVYGPDHGYVTEMANAIAKSSGIVMDDAFAFIRMSAAEAANDSHLINEAHTVAMFAGKRVLRIVQADNDKALLKQVNTLLEDPPEETIIVLEAGELRKGTSLRKAVEKSTNGLAIPCYGDNSAAVHALIDDTFPRAEGKLHKDTRQYLASVLGADRALTRAELEKLALFGNSTSQIELKDAMALVGDASENSAFEMIDSVFAGHLEQFEQSYLSFEMTGQNPNAIATLALMQLRQFGLMRHAIEGEGQTAQSVLQNWRPPVFGNRRQTVESILRIWSTQALSHAMKRLQDTVLQFRQKPGLDREILHLALLGLTIAARRRR